MAWSTGRVDNSAVNPLDWPETPLGGLLRCVFVPTWAPSIEVHACSAARHGVAGDRRYGRNCRPPRGAPGQPPRSVRRRGGIRLQRVGDLPLWSGPVRGSLAALFSLLRRLQGTRGRLLGGSAHGVPAPNTLHRPAAKRPRRHRPGDGSGSAVMAAEPLPGRGGDSRALGFFRVVALPSQARLPRSRFVFLP